MKRALLLGAGMSALVACGGPVVDDVTDQELSAEQASCPSTTQHDAVDESMFRRVVLGRLYIEGASYVPGQDPTSVGHALASLSPTYVSGLVRINDPLYPSPGERDAYESMKKGFAKARATVRAEPRAADAKFDVVLGAKKFECWSASDCPKSLHAMLERVKSDFSPDVIFFDFFDSGAFDHVQKKWLMALAIAWGNANHVLVGGNFLGKYCEPHGTEHADFFAVVDEDDFSGHGTSGLYLTRLRGLKSHYHRPVLMHINNNPQAGAAGGEDGAPDSGCKFMGVSTGAYSGPTWSWHDRWAYEVRRASEQSTYGYRYMYNVFFPACAIAPDDLSHQWYYDATTDVHDGASMLQVMRGLASKYDP